MLKQENSSKSSSRIKPLSLKKNFSWTFIGNLIYAFTQWGLLIVLAKLGSPEIVGKFSLALAITAPIMMLTNLQLRGIQATDTKEIYKFSDYLGLRIITSSFSFLVVICLVFIFKYPMDTAIVILMISIAKIIESISDVIYGLIQKNESMDLISKSVIYKGVLSLLALATTVWFTGSLFWGTFALAVSWFFILIFYDIRNANHFEKAKPTFNGSKIKDIVKLSLPLGIVLMMGSLNTNIPRYFVELYINEEALGYFAAMAYLIVAGNTVMNALAQSASPRLARFYSQGEFSSFKKLVLKIMGIGIVVGLIGLLMSIFFGEFILTLVYQAEYAKHSYVFILIMIAGLINYSGASLGYGITAARAFKIQPFMGVVWLISSLIFSFIFIPNYGLIGAAYTLISSSIIQFLSKLFVLRFLLNKKLKSSN